MYIFCQFLSTPYFFIGYFGFILIFKEHFFNINNKNFFYICKKITQLCQHLDSKH